ncbi:MAG: esterase [Lachnospiraceae bacterium]|nr:esterase [Lachnospiraceae bacterium]
METKENITVNKKPCFLYDTENPTSILIQAIDEHDLEVLDSEILKIRELSKEKFILLAFLVDNWNDDLSPWIAPTVFGNEKFGGKAHKTLEYVENDLLPYLKEKYGSDKKLYIGGYSLSALFALWACYNTDIFDGVVAASPSMWFPGFVKFARDNNIKVNKIYLSLGNKEEKTKNKTMATVGDNIREYHDMLSKDSTKEVILEWNEGNHFIDSDMRTAKGFAWIMS